MQSRHYPMAAALILTLGLAAGCASTPTNVQPLAANADPAYEIQRTDSMLQEAKANQLNVLSPKYYDQAESSLKKAKSYLDDKKSNDKILEQVAYSRAWLTEAKDKSAISTTTLKDITDARAGAIKAGAPDVMPKEWDKAEKQLESVTKSIEKGNTSPADKKEADIIQSYRNLERESVMQTNLGKAKQNIDIAKKYGAEKKAPRTYADTISKYEAAQKVITENPRDMASIDAVSEEATIASSHLVEVTDKVKAGNSEDLVLMAEGQQRQISNLKQQNTMNKNNLNKSQAQLTEAEKQNQELAKTQALTEQAAKLRQQFKPAEAEVYTENGKLMVRLKALQFPSNQSNLGPKNQAFLKKVETAVNDINPSKITVEGHTDSVGNAEKNQVLSEKRAQSVEKFFVANGKMDDSKVDAVGRGDEAPISDNKTARGRAQNRRIDLVIETQSE